MGYWGWHPMANDYALNAVDKFLEECPRDYDDYEKEQEEQKVYLKNLSDDDFERLLDGARIWANFSEFIYAIPYRYIELGCTDISEKRKERLKGLLKESVYSRRSSYNDLLKKHATITENNREYLDYHLQVTLKYFDTFFSDTAKEGYGYDLFDSLVARLSDELYQDAINTPEKKRKMAQWLEIIGCDPSAIEKIGEANKKESFYLKAIERRFECYNYIDDSFKTEAFNIKCLQADERTFIFFEDKYKRDAKFLVKNAKYLPGVFYKVIDDSVKGEITMSKIIKKCPYLISEIPYDWPGYEHIVLKGITRDDTTLKYCNPALLENKEFMLRACEEWGLSIQYASESLMKDKGFVIQVLKTRVIAYKGLSYEDRKNEEYIKAAVSRSEGAFILPWIPEEVVTKELVLYIINEARISGAMVSYGLHMSDELRNDPDIAPLLHKTPF